PFHGIIGRQNDYLLTPDGVRLSGAGLTLIGRDFDSVLKLQFVQESPDRARLLVLPLPAFDEAQRRQLLAVARAKLPPSIIEVSVEPVAELRRTAAGKSPFVVRSFEGLNPTKRRKPEGKNQE